MDELDRAIIRELSEDARRPFCTIAKKLGISTQTIIRRYSELKANGTITFSSIRMNLEKLGYAGTALLLIDTQPETSSAEIVEQLKKIPGVFIATRTLGNYEAYAVLAFREVKELYQKVARIKQLPNITNVDVSFGLPGIKYFPPKSTQFNPPIEAS